MESPELPSTQKRAEAPTAEEYKELEKTISAKRSELTTASVDKLPGLVAELQGLEGKRLDSIDAAYDEAKEENDQFDADAVFDEAHAENQRMDEEAQERARVEQIDQEIGSERQKLGHASVEELSAIVGRIRELEMQKINPSEAEPEQISNGDAALSENQPIEAEAAAEEKEYRISEEEFDQSLDEIFELNRQISAGGTWYEKGVIPAHVLETAVDEEIGEALGLAAGAEVQSDSFNGAAELMKIAEEVDALPNEAKTYRFYDSSLPDIIKRIQDMDVSIAQRFGPLGKLKKTLSASPNVEKLFQTLDAAKPSYDEWKRLQGVRDEKVAAIQEDARERFGTGSTASGRSLTGYIGTAEEWKKA